MCKPDFRSILLMTILLSTDANVKEWIFNVYLDENKNRSACV
jgi:hypothetical protein